MNSIRYIYFFNQVEEEILVISLSDELVVKLMQVEAFSGHWKLNWEKLPSGC